MTNKTSEIRLRSELHALCGFTSSYELMRDAKLAPPEIVEWARQVHLDTKRILELFNKFTDKDNDK